MSDTIELEDNFADILGKARRGLGFSTDEAARGAGLSEKELLALLDGDFSVGNAVKLARFLKLNAASLVAIAQGEYQPGKQSVSGVFSYESPFHAWGVNAYVLWDEASGEAAMIDTGTDSKKGLGFIKERGLNLQQVFLTHADSDHIGGLEKVREVWPEVRVWVNELEDCEDETVKLFEAGSEFAVGALRVGTRRTWGHTRGGTTFLVDGLAKRVAFVGDAIFAGSIGMARLSYEASVQTCEREIFSLGNEVVLFAGHGPPTTVGEEKKRNPFFAGR